MRFLVRFFFYFIIGLVVGRMLARAEEPTGAQLSTQNGVLLECLKTPAAQMTERQFENWAMSRNTRAYASAISVMDAARSKMPAARRSTVSRNLVTFRSFDRWGDMPTNINWLSPMARRAVPTSGSRSEESYSFERIFREEPTPVPVDIINPFCWEYWKGR